MIVDPLGRRGFFQGVDFQEGVGGGIGFEFPFAGEGRGVAVQASNTSVCRRPALRTGFTRSAMAITK